MDIINKPLGWILNLCSKIVGGNYFFAILIFAVFVEIVLLPFGISQQKKSIKQARLRPKEQAIRKKYAGRDDRATQMKMQEEIQELYQKEGYNPMSGCLPLLIQFPLLISLFQVVYNPLKYICGFSDDAVLQIQTIVGTSSSNSTMGILDRIRETPYEHLKNVEGFTQTIYDSIPTLTVFKKFNLALTPKECMNTEALTDIAGWLVLLVPVFTFVAYFVSMKVNRKLMYQPMNDANQAQMGCSNNVMDIVMPLFSVFLAFSYPAALGIYWIFKCLLGILKQFILSKAMPLPVFSEEDFKAAEKEVNARLDKNAKVQKSGRVVRSLHHIDDEDFEDTAEKARIFKEKLAAQEEADKQKAEEAKKNSRFGALKLKDESDKPSNTNNKNEKNEKNEKDNVDNADNADNTKSEEKTDDKNGEN